MIKKAKRYRQMDQPTNRVGCRKSRATKNLERTMNKAGYTATLVACGWAGAVLEKVTRASGQEPYAQKRRKSKKGTNRPTD